MECKEALWQRRSVRRYTEEAVPEDMLVELMEAAMAAPSACNLTPWEFYVVTEPEKLAQLRGVTPYTNMAAPAAIVVCGCTDGARLPMLRDYWVQDCSAATENILLRAVDLGLGTVWCGIHPQPEPSARVQEILGIPGNHFPLNIIWVGWPARVPEARTQYAEEKVHWVR